VVVAGGLGVVGGLRDFGVVGSGIWEGWMVVVAPGLAVVGVARDFDLLGFLGVCFPGRDWKVVYLVGSFLGIIRVPVIRQPVTQPLVFRDPVFVLNLLSFPFGQRLRLDLTCQGLLTISLQYLHVFIITAIQFHFHIIFCTLEKLTFRRFSLIISPINIDPLGPSMSKTIRLHSLR
jgi:hypothetical protein